MVIICFVRGAEQGWWSNMDEKDKLIKEQRAEISELRDKLDSMKKLAEIWNDWKPAIEEQPDYDPRMGREARLDLQRAHAEGEGSR